MKSNDFLQLKSKMLLFTCVKKQLMQVGLHFVPPNPQYGSWTPLLYTV